MMNQLITSLVLLLVILIFVGGVWLLWSRISRFRRRKSTKEEAIVFQNKPEPQQSPSENKSAVRKKIVSLLYGDHKAVERLIHAAKLKQPGKSEQWYEEKVLEDLESDRL